MNPLAKIINLELTKSKAVPADTAEYRRGILERIDWLIAEDTALDADGPDTPTPRESSESSHFWAGWNFLVGLSPVVDDVQPWDRS